LFCAVCIPSQAGFGSPAGAGAPVVFESPVAAASICSAEKRPQTRLADVSSGAPKPVRAPSARAKTRLLTRALACCSPERVDGSSYIEMDRAFVPAKPMKHEWFDSHHTHANPLAMSP